MKLSSLTDVKNAILLYIWTSKYCIPNGDPFTGVQRFDEATSRILVSDVRIKRYIRDYLILLSILGGRPIYVCDKYSKDGEGTASSARVLELSKELKIPLTDGMDLTELVLKTLDGALFGGITTVKEDGMKDESGKKIKVRNAKITGAIQFYMLNPSITKVLLFPHQNTSMWESDIKEKSQGAIATTQLVPFSVNQVTGFVSPIIAYNNKVAESDVMVGMDACWKGLTTNRSRSKTGQDSRVLIKINMAEPDDVPIADADSLVTIKEADNTELRDISKVTWDFSRLLKAASGPRVASIEYRMEQSVLTAFTTQMSPVQSKLVSF